MSIFSCQSIRALAVVLISFALADPISALDPPSFLSYPTPVFGEQHIQADGSDMIAYWHTGPSDPDYLNHLPYMVYVGYFRPSLHSFLSWEGISVGSSNGRWNWVRWGGFPYAYMVNWFPELSRYAPYGFLAFSAAAPDGDGLAGLPAGAAPCTACGCP